MGRLIHTASTGKQRNQLRRTIAELLRRLSQKQAVDKDTKDMVAFAVYCLREIDSGIESSAAAWEKRDYWMKAEGLRKDWRWVSDTADELTELVMADTWDNLPMVMVKLIPYFADIHIAKFTRNPDMWQGACEQLKAEADE